MDYLAPTLYLTDIIVFCLLVFWLIDKIKIRNQESGIRNKKPIIHNSLFMILSMLAVFLILGILLSKNQAVGLYGFLKLLEFIFLGFYTARNIKRLNFGIVLLLFSIGIIFESFLAILQYFNQGSMGGIFYFLGERTFNSQTPGIANASVNGELVLRPYGTFSHPNVLAGFLVIAMTLVSSEFKVQSSKFSKTTTVVSLAIGTVALFLTMSRVAIIIWLLAVGIWFMHYDWYNLIKRKFSIFNSKFEMKSKKLNFKNYNIENSMKIKNFKLKIIIAIFISAILLISPLHSRFTNIRLSDESITQRGELIKDSFSMIKSHPIFGVGLNNFLVELPSVHKQDSNVFYLQPVHNIFLLIAAQTGIVGLFFFLWFIFKTYKRIRNHELGIRNQGSIIHNSKFIILSTVLVLGLFDHYFLTLQQGQLLFSFVLGLCWSKSSKLV